MAACADDRPNYYYWSSRHQKDVITAKQVAVTPPSLLATTTPYPGDRIDGSYQGTIHLTSTPTTTPSHWWRRPTISDETCPHRTYGIAEIADHTLYYTYAPNLIFNVPVANDGTLQEAVANATLTGKVGLGHLTFQIVTPVCTSKFFGDFKLNHS
jgi:hypothetical protein